MVISLEMSSQNTPKIASLGIKIYFFLPPPEVLRMSAFPGKERPGAYVNNDEEVIEL